MKKIYRSTLLAAAAAVLLTGAGIGASALQGDSPPGKDVYVEFGCYQCHGYQGQGGAGPVIAPDPLPYEAFVAVVRQPPNVMPAYSPKVISDRQLKQMHEYLESIPQPPAPADLPVFPGE